MVYFRRWYFFNRHSSKSCYFSSLSCFGRWQIEGDNLWYRYLNQNWQRILRVRTKQSRITMYSKGRKTIYDNKESYANYTLLASFSIWLVLSTENKLSVWACFYSLCKAKRPTMRPQAMEVKKMGKKRIDGRTRPLRVMRGGCMHSKQKCLSKPFLRSKFSILEFLTWALHSDRGTDAIMVFALYSWCMPCFDQSVTFRPTDGSTNGSYRDARKHQ